MRILIVIMMMWSAMSTNAQEIWQLTPWPPDSNYVLGALPSGEPTWVKVDSLGVADSIYISGDSIRLRDGAGVAQLPTASTSTKGLLSSTDWTTFNNKGNGTVTNVTASSPLASTGGTTPNISIQNASTSTTGALTSTDWTIFNSKFTLPSLTSGSVLFSNGSTISQDNSSFFWDDTNNRLGLGTTTPAYKLDVISSDIQVNGARIGLGGGNVSTNVAFGNSALNANTSGTFNVAIGQGALQNYLSDLNVALGWGTSNYRTSGVNNLAIGSQSMRYANNGANNVGVGSLTLVNLTGTENVAIGTSAGIAMTSADYNVVIGQDAGASLTTGDQNTYVGRYAGGYNSTGSGNVCIGHFSGFLSNTSNILSIENGFVTSPLIGGNFATDKVGINNALTDLTRTLDVNGDLRIRDVVTTTPTKLMSIDNDGVVSSLGLSGLSISGGNLVGPTGTVTSVGINTGGGVTSVSGSPVTGSGNISLTLADQSASNELQTISTSGTAGNITLSNGGGTLNLNVNDADANATNELQNLTLTGQTLDISQGAGVTLPIIDVVQGSGITVNKLNGIATISASSAGSTEYIDPYIISSDTVGFILKNVMDTVQFIGVAGVTGESTTVSDSPTINMTLTGTNITGEIVDGSVTPAKLSQAYLTSEVDGSTTNEIQTLSISGSDLTISGAGGNTVTLPSGGGSSEWASLHYGSLAANTQTLTSSVWNTINFTGSSESNASIIDANHTNDEIEFVVAGTYRVDYRVSFIANADALIYSGIYSSTSSSVDVNTQMESDTDSGYKHTIMQHSYIKTAVAGEKIKLQVQPLIAHTSVAIYSNFIVTKL